MDIRPVREGQLLVIPREHVDHFTDLGEELASEVLMTGHRLARALRELVSPKRVGVVIHGFGVAHAHMVIVPLEHPWDITAAQCAQIEDSRIVFRWEALPLVDRPRLDQIAARVRTHLASHSGTRGGYPEQRR